MSALTDEGPACCDEFSDGEFKIMARVLECRHGARAAEIAAFFALEHRMMGDIGRASAWTSVASLLRRKINAVATNA